MPNISVVACLIYEIMRDWDNYDVYSFDSIKTLTDSMRLIDEA